MASWIQRTKRKDGTLVFWIRDIRDGRQVVIGPCVTEGEAQIKQEQYDIRQSLEKEGYDDRYVIDIRTAR